VLLRRGFIEIAITRATERAQPGWVRVSGGRQGHGQRLLASVASAPENRAALRLFLARHLGAQRVFDLVDAEIVERIERLRLTGVVRLYRRPRPTARDVPAEAEDDSPEAASARPPDVPEPPEALKTWVEIELLDGDGQPVAGEPYAIDLPDGRVVEGRLDARGVAGFYDLDAGVCAVRFPRLDGAAVGARPPAGSTEQRPAKLAPERIDPVAQAGALRRAAASGVPFCEECARPRDARAGST
jgi:hypothetical protein